MIVKVGPFCRTHHYPHPFSKSCIITQPSIVKSVLGLRATEGRHASLGPKPASRRWTAGLRARGFSTPTGFYNKAWGRRDNGAPQENLPCDSNLNGVPQFAAAAIPSYLACAPEENQETLSRNFTSLLKAVIRSRGPKLGRIVYVSDAGKIETAYWKNVLRHLHVDGQRIRIDRIVDYYHASLRLTMIADALVLTSSQRTQWLKRVRKLLLEPGGWGRVMRSISGMLQEHGIKPAEKDEFEKAKRYLHRYRKFMNYAEHRSQGSPIGSGIVESACKQIVSERLKLSKCRIAP